jgi:serine/threonine-protein kinase
MPRGVGARARDGGTPARLEYGRERGTRFARGLGAMAIAVHAPKPGDVIDRKYVLRERIGEGGMGTVFVADQPALARSVAIKILHPRHAADRDLALRFRDEAVAASRVRHPGVVAVFDASHLDDGTPYIVMEYVAGRPLGDIIATERIAVPRALALVDRILDVLAATHGDGVVHADVKSDNFLVGERDGEEHVTLIDFGLARVADLASARDTPLISGTPEYMAPEVIRGERPEIASDLYGAGVILYELLVGKTPFAGGTPSEIMARHLDDIAIPPSLRRPDRDIPRALDAVVERALAKRPGDRFGDAAAFARALHAIARRRNSCGERRLRIDPMIDAPVDRDAITRVHAMRVARRG